MNRLAVICLLGAALAPLGARGQALEMNRLSLRYREAFLQVQLTFIGKSPDESIVKSSIEAVCPLFRKTMERTGNSLISYDGLHNTLCEGAFLKPCGKPIQWQTHLKMRELVAQQCALQVKF